MKRYGAEFFGTFWLVLGGCGSAVLATAFPNVGISFHGVSRGRSLGSLVLPADCRRLDLTQGRSTSTPAGGLNWKWSAPQVGLAS